MRNPYARCVPALVGVCVIVTMAATVFAVDGGSNEDLEAIAWISANAVPLSNVEAGNGFADLEPLKDVLADVRVVGLGEATHGTREIFQFKHRMLEFLVEEMGFTVFAIEASFPACLSINRYVLYGEGDRDEAIASMGFWTWDTEEVTAMVEWIRAHNQSVPAERKVRFLGDDLQYIDGSLDVVAGYFERVAPDRVDAVERAFETVRIDPYEIAAMSQVAEEMKQTRLQGLLAVIGYLELHRDEFVVETSLEEYQLVLQHARIVAQFYDAYSRPMYSPDSPRDTGAAMRDLYMAYNVRWMIETAHPGAKAVVWAHNGHVSKASWGGGVPAQGRHLRRMYGDAYYVFGFEFDRGGFQARNLDPEAPDEEYGVLREFRVGPAADGSLAADLRQVVDGDFVIDFRGLPAGGPVVEMLATPHPMAFIGAGFAESMTTAGFRTPTVVIDHFDGLVFLHSTTRARPNPSGKRGPIPRQAIPG